MQQFNFRSRNRKSQQRFDKGIVNKINVSQIIIVFLLDITVVLKDRDGLWLLARKQLVIACTESIKRTFFYVINNPSNKSKIAQLLFKI